MSQRTNEKSLTATNGQAPKQTTPGSDFKLDFDPLQGWFGLAANVKPSRTERRSKRGWKRQSQRGLALLVVLELLLCVALMLLIVGGGS